MLYQAFLSYSHGVDGRLAPALQSALHRFAKPWYRLRALRIFRDTTSLSANPGLWASIERALAQSEYLLLLASPESARSTWVEREIDWWLTHRAADRLLIVLTGGALAWDAAAGDWDWERTAALSPGLRGRFHEEPLFVDLRWATDADALSLRNARFRGAVLDLAATLHGRPKDELDGEDLRLHRATRRLAAAAICLLVMLTIAAGAGAWIAHRQAQLAEGRRREADRQRRIALARQLAAEAEVTRTQQAAMLPLSVLLAIEATRRLERLGLRSPESDQTLRQGLAVLPARSDVLPHRDVVAATVAIDGVHAATVARDGSVRVWDLPARREVGRSSIAGTVLTAAFSPDLTWLATVLEGLRREVQLRDVGSGAVHSRVVADGWVTDLAFSPDGRLLATGGLDHIVRVIAVADGREILRAPHRAVVNAIAWSADATLLATATGSPADQLLGRPPQDQAGHVWDVRTGRQLAALPHERTVETIAISPDGRLVATGSLDATARLWDARTGRELTRVVHEENVAKVAFAPDGQRVASGSGPYLIGFQMQTVRLWDIQGRELGRVTHEGGVRDLVFSPDGSYLLTASADSTARLIDRTGREATRMSLAGPAGVVAFSPDGRTAFTAGSEVRVWPIGGGADATQLAEQHPVFKMAYSPDGSRLATVGNTLVASLWAPARAQRSPVGLAHEGYVVDVAFAPGGALVATAGHDRSARLWDGTSGAPRGRLDHNAEVLRVAFSDDGGRVATASVDGSARIWDVVSAGERARFEHGARVTAVAFAPGGRFLATGTDAGDVRLWDIATGAEAARFSLGVEVGRLAHSPAGRYLAAAGYGPVAMVYDTVTRGNPVRLVHDREVQAIAYAPDGRLLATAANDGLVRLWEPAGGREIARLRHDGIDALAFSLEGRHLITGGTDRTARLWDLERFGEVVRLAHPTAVNAVAFSPDGHHLTTASGDPLAPAHTVREWLWQAGDLVAEACARLDRNLSQEEWQRHFGNEPYRKTCKHVVAHPTVLTAELERARATARRGDAARSAMLYRRLVREAVAGSDAQIANGVCWLGSLDGRASDVLAACERAVTLAPDDGQVRDSRGLARALTGDRSGAIDDFTAFIAWARPDAALAAGAAQREAWVATLRAGGDPFDADALRALRESEAGREDGSQGGAG